MVVHRGIGLPDKFRTRLIWNQAVVLTGFSSALTQSYAVRLNGPYDPQVALGGSQPQYYDMLASMYSTYMVRGAKISCTFSPTTSSTAGDGALCGWCQVWSCCCTCDHKPIYSYTDAQHRAYNYVTEWKFRFGYTNV